MSCSVGHRQGSDLALLWLWRRLTAAVLIQPYAARAALKKGGGQEIMIQEWRREFPGSLVVRIWRLHCCGMSSIPSLGMEIPQQQKYNFYGTLRHSPQKKRMEKENLNESY